MNAGSDQISGSYISSVRHNNLDLATELGEGKYWGQETKDAGCPKCS